MEIERKDHVGSIKIATLSKSKKRKSRSSAAMNEASVATGKCFFETHIELLELS